MAYKNYFLRGLTRADLLSDLQSVLPNDTPYLWEETDQEGNLTGRLVIDNSIAVLVPEGEWWLTRPEYDSDGNVITQGDAATYAILNVRTDDPALQELIEQFAASDPSLEPSSVPPEEKIGTGTHRITEPTSPARVFQ